MALHAYNSEIPASSYRLAIVRRFRACYNWVGTGRMRFIADHMVGKLAKWLRIMGYDTAYDRELSDSELVQKAVDEDRIILTRDTRLIQRKLASNHVFIQSDHLMDQIRQLMTELNLEVNVERLFTRCLVCNAQLNRIEKEEVKDRVPPYVYQTQESFAHCPHCDRIYWRGTHVDHVFQRLGELAASIKQSRGG